MTPQELAEAARCFCFPRYVWDPIEIYQLITIANGGVAPQAGIELGNPDENWAFGDPTTGVTLGAPA